MGLTLYAATIPSYLQILGALRLLLGTAERFCTEKKLPPETILQARLAEDMLSFAHQVKFSVLHSSGAAEGARRGLLSPDMSPPPDTFGGLGAIVTDGLKALENVQPGEFDALLGREVRFALRDRQLTFTAEEFLLSFAQPNFYFHVTTAYDILRWKGLPIGKRDFMGQVRTKQKA